ncbi:MAG: ABC transporter permease [Treponema sp.]|jgi:ABC-type nitrate/sulfonate/bicarbonate transport system permease component|nr:ABC transporter permease [Treponema sp.]
MYTFLVKRSGPRSATDTSRLRVFRGSEKPSIRITNFIGFLVIGAVWQFAAHIRASPVLPSLGGILWTAINLLPDKAFTRHIGASLKLIFFGTGMAAAAGFTIGLLVFRYDWIKDAFVPVIECVRGIASLTLFPLLIIVFGLSIFSRAFIIFWTAWPAVMLSTLHSLDIDRNVVDAARTCGAGEWKIITHIRIPMAMRGIITGVRIGIGGGWVSLITAEMLGASKGLGYYLLWCSQSFEFRKVYAVILIIAAIGGTMNYGLLRLQRMAIQISGE